MAQTVTIGTGDDGDPGDFSTLRSSRVGMDMRELKVHSFILKIWLEEDDDGAERPFWRAHITHVPTGERRHLRRLSDVKKFIEPYLASPDDKFKRGSFARRLVRRLTVGRTRRFH